MIASLFLALFPAPLQGAPVASPAELDPAPDPAPAPEPYDGGYYDGMQELYAKSRAGDLAGAQQIGESLLAEGRVERWRTQLEEFSGGRSELLLAPLRGPLAWLGVETSSAADRAEVHYALGLAQAAAGVASEADQRFERARVVAGGPGDVRLDATYALGTLDLMLGETFRQRIPEIAEKLGLPPPPPPAPAAPTGGGAEPEPPPDPIDLARSAYSMAREHLIERLRADWRDADARANAELCVRRLRELDELERQREEQQQENQDPQESDEKQDSEDQQDQEQDPSEDSENQDESQKDDESEEDEEEPKQDEEPQEDESEEEEQQQEPEPKEGEEQEAVLTQEEVKRLLQRLAELEEKGEEIRERLQRVRRERVERDW